MVPTGLPPLVKACRCSNHSCSSWELLQKTVMRSTIPPAKRPSMIRYRKLKASFHTVIEHKTTITKQTHSDGLKQTSNLKRIMTGLRIIQMFGHCASWKLQPSLIKEITIFKTNKSRLIINSWSSKLELRIIRPSKWVDVYSLCWS